MDAQAQVMIDDVKANGSHLTGINWDEMSKSIKLTEVHKKYDKYASLRIDHNMEPSLNPNPNTIEISST
jgi:hypothetical protein